MASTAITIAEGANAVDPNKYTVNLENLSNGVIRSVLTIVRPEPDSSQVKIIATIYLRNGNLQELKLTTRRRLTIVNRFPLQLQRLKVVKFTSLVTANSSTPTWPITLQTHLHTSLETGNNVRPLALPQRQLK